MVQGASAARTSSRPCLATEHAGRTGIALSHRLAPCAVSRRARRHRSTGPNRAIDRIPEPAGTAGHAGGSMTERSSQLMTPVAIVGMASILPDARYLEQFWDN